jgi:hypothetical protein
LKSFLVNGKRPIIKWGMLPDNTFFEGLTPEGFSLAVTPSEGVVIIDVDRHGYVDGFENIPSDILKELNMTLNYNTENNGKHYWIKYTGVEVLANKSSKIGIDLRTNRGYAVYYPDNDIRDQMYLVQNSSETLNNWLQSLFGYVNK